MQGPRRTAAATLCQLALRAPAEPIRLTRHQLAALVGATRERTTTALGELANHDVIRLRRGKIVIHDPTRLAAVADGADRRYRETRECWR